MTRIIIIGAGGHAAEISDYIRHAQIIAADGCLEIAGLLDDNPENYQRYQFSAPLLGPIHGHVVRHDVAYIIGIANPAYRGPVIERFLSEGAEFATFIHGSALVSGTARIGKGVVVAPNANIGPNVKIGDFNLLNARCSMGHDTVVGDFNFISPNVCFSGFTVVGDHNLFGINSATIPGIHVGNRNKIAAGMVLDKNVGDDSVVFYRYKEKVISVPRGLDRL